MRKNLARVSVPASENMTQSQPVILNMKQVAKLLLVSEKSIYEMTRPRAKARLPHFKAGKYLRFEQAAIIKWIATEQERRLAA